MTDPLAPGPSPGASLTPDRRRPVARVQSERPPVGTMVICYFGANKYRGTVVRYGRTEPVVRFTLRNGKVKEGRATILPAGAALGVEYSGYLAQLWRNEPKPSDPAAPLYRLACVCGKSWKVAGGEREAGAFARHHGHKFYPNSPNEFNVLCAECQEMDGDE